MIGINLSLYFEISLSLLLGMLGMTLLGGIASGLVLGARRAAILVAVLILPLSLPILIFGTMSGMSLIQSQPIKSHLYLLTALDLCLIVVSIPAMQLGLKNAIEND
tara:strand:- start:251 stop:568 length:318 start_codon:yes stop_codon:yes gene_type:complete